MEQYILLSVPMLSLTEDAFDLKVLKSDVVTASELQKPTLELDGAVLVVPN